MKLKAALTFLLCSAIVFAAAYFYLKTPLVQPTIRDLIYQEVMEISHLLQDYNRADLLYRLGNDEASFKEAISLLHGIEKKIVRFKEPENNDVPKIVEKSPAHYYFLDFIETFNTLIDNYNLMVEDLTPQIVRATSSKILSDYNKVLVKTDVYIQALMQLGESNQIIEKDIISFAKEILLSTYKTDSYAYRTEIYDRLAELMHIASSSGKPIIIGVKIDLQMNLHFIMRKPDDLLYDIVFSDLVQSLPLYGILPLHEADIALAGRYINRLTNKYVHGKQLTFLQANPNAPIDPKKLIILLEDGNSVQEHLLKMGATRLDPALPNIPIKWEIMQDNAKELKLGIYQ